MDILNPYTGKGSSVGDALKLQLLSGESVEVIGVPVSFRAYALLLRGQREHSNVKINIKLGEATKIVTLKDLDLNFDLVNKLNPDW